MIREIGSVELFELCDTIPKVQCSECLLYWNQGVIYCTCGHLLLGSESSQNFNKWRLDALSIPRYVIKKERRHGARHGKTEVQREYHLAWNAWERCCKKVDSQGGHFTGIHDRFLRDPVYRESQLAIGWTEQKCKEWDELAKRRPSISSHSRWKEKIPQDNGILPWTNQATMGLWKLRSDFRAVVSMKNRKHHESGEQIEEPISPEQYRIWHPSSSTSRWDKNWKWAHKNF